LPSFTSKAAKSLVRCPQYQRQEKPWNHYPLQQEVQKAENCCQRAERDVSANGSRQHRAKIRWNSFVVCVQPARECPNHVEDDRAYGDSCKVTQRPPERRCYRRGLFPELIVEVVQCSCMEHERRCRDKHHKKNTQCKLPDLCLWDEQPRCKQSKQDRIQKELQKP